MFTLTQGEGNSNAVAGVVRRHCYSLRGDEAPFEPNRMPAYTADRWTTAASASLAVCAQSVIVGNRNGILTVTGKFLHSQFVFLSRKARPAFTLPQTSFDCLSSRESNLEYQRSDKGYSHQIA